MLTAYVREKLPNNGKGPSEKIKSMPGTHSQLGTVPVPTRQADNLKIPKALDRAHRRVLPQWWGAVVGGELALVSSNKS